MGYIKIPLKFIALNCLYQEKKLENSIKTINDIEKEIAHARTTWCVWEAYKNFKREHKMMSW